MKKWVKVLLIVVGLYIIIGAVAGNLLKGEETAEVSKEVTPVDSELSEQLTASIKDDHADNSGIDLFRRGEVEPDEGLLTVYSNIKPGTEYNRIKEEADKVGKMTANTYYSSYDDQFELKEIRILSSEDALLGYDYEDPRLIE